MSSERIGEAFARVTRNVPSFESAPSQKKSMSDRTATTVATPVAALSFAVRRAIKKFFSCSNTVYYATRSATCQLMSNHRDGFTHLNDWIQNQHQRRSYAPP